MKTLPTSAHLETERLADLGPGLVGLVTAVWQSMVHQSPELSGLLDELLCVSSAAFCNYVYDPAYNSHEDPPRAYSELGELFTNYGAYESIEYYTGWNVQELNDLDADGFWTLVCYELSEGRPVVTIAPDGFTPTLLVGYDGGEGRTVVTTDGDEFDVASADWQDSEVFRNWLVFVRPGERAEWAASINRLRVDVLRWAATHARNTREFLQETLENYSPGLRGMETFAQRLERVAEQTDQVSADEAAYVRRHLDSLAIKREALLSRGPRWAHDLAGVFEDAAVERVEDALDAWQQAAALRAEQSSPLHERYRAALEHEERAIRSLETAIERFPGPFESF